MKGTSRKRYCNRGNVFFARKTVVGLRKSFCGVKPLFQTDFKR